MAQWTPKESKQVYKNPKSIQKSIPVKAVHPHGIFEHNGEYSMTGAFTDVNYQAGSPEDQQYIFASHQELIKALEIDELAKLNIINWPINRATLEQDLFMQMENDGLDFLREEVNQINLDRATVGSNNIRQSRYLTVTTGRKKLHDSEVWFNRMESTLKNAFSKIGSSYTRLDTPDRLKIFHDIFRSGEEQHFNLDLDLTKRRGHSFKDAIRPHGLDFYDDHIRVGKKYARVLVLDEYPAYLRDSLISELTALPKQMVLSVDYISKSKEDSLQRVQAKLLSVDTEISQSTKRSNEQGNYNATIPLRLDEKRRGLTDVIRLIKEYDQRIVFCQVLVMHMADSLQELDHDTETLTSIGQRHMCQFSVLRNQMEAGMNTCLPYGLRFVSNLRTVSTENASTLIPFVCTDLWQPGGMCIGTNPMSKSVVILNTLLAPSQNFWVLGMTGAGKSMFLKWQILNIFLSRPEDDIIWLDPEREGGPVMKLLNDKGYGNQCEFIHLSAGSSQHINAFDPMKFVQDGDDPISIKCDFVLTFFETAIGSSNMGAIQQSIVDRCTRRLLMNAQKDGITVTLEDLYLLLLEQEEPEARDLATAMELYVMGSLNCFSQPTNVNMDSRLLCFDIRDLHAGKTKSLGMLITIDAIQNRISYNRSRGKRTWLFCDEAWILMAEPVTARFFDSFWRRLRKYGGAGEALSQNVTSLLNTDYGRDMLGNSEHIVMFNQSQKDRAALQDILGLSDMQLNFINNAESGTGLLRTSNVVVPFDGRFSKDTTIYRAFTTKIEEVSELA